MTDEMKSGMRTYDIHNLITAETDIDLNIPDMFLADTVTSSPDVRVIREDIDIPVPRTKMKQRKDYAYYRDGDRVIIDYGVMDLTVSVSSISDTFTVKFSRGYEKANISHLRGLWEIALHLKLLQKDHVLFHAGGVDFNGSGFLVPGLGSTGKTYTTLSLIDGERYQYLSDDLVILGSDGSAYSYPQPTGTGPYTIENDALADELDQSRIKDRLADIPIFSILFGRYPWLYKSRETSVPAEMVCNETEVERLFLITGDGDRGVVESDLDTIIHKLLTQHFDTNKLLNNHILNCYSFLTGHDLVDQFDRTKTVLKQALADVDCYELTSPTLEAYPDQIATTVENR
jgi:hypothetical protein